MLVLLSMDLDKDRSRRAEPSWEPAAESGAREDAVTLSQGIGQEGWRELRDV